MGRKGIFEENLLFQKGIDEQKVRGGGRPTRRPPLATRLYSSQMKILSLYSPTFPNP